MSIVQNNKVVQVFDCGDIEISLLITLAELMRHQCTGFYNTQVAGACKKTKQFR